jgi:hypothetical protein
MDLYAEIAHLPLGFSLVWHAGGTVAIGAMQRRPWPVSRGRAVLVLVTAGLPLRVPIVP